MARAKRRREEWTTEVTRYRASGQTAEVYAARRGLNVSTLRWWSARIGIIPTSTAALREVVVDPAGHDAASFGLRLGSVELRLEVGTDPRYVAAVAAGLAEAGRVC